MKIKDKEVNLKITPRAMQTIEEKYKDFDILKILREVGENEPRLSDYYKIIYAGFLGATKEEINYEDFLDSIENYDLYEITNIGVELLAKRKN